MTGLTIVADDLTGAAEAAAVAYTHGLQARLWVGGPGAVATDDMAIAVDTESRQLEPSRAALAVREVCVGIGAAEVYKKTDSVLRGNVRAELEEAMRCLRARRCILVPCNPGLGRTIHHGIYRIHGVPLDRTEFRADPTHPVSSSRVVDLLGGGVSRAAPGGPVAPRGIVVGDATTADDLAAWASVLDPQTIAAGGVEFLAAILARRGRAPRERPVVLPAGPRLLVSGSRSAAARGTLAALAARGAPVLAVGAGPRARLGARASRIAALCIQDTARGEPRVLQDLLCEAAVDALVDGSPALLLAEGGATAAALALRLGWSAFRVAGVAAPGVVVLRPDVEGAPCFVVKPGSYPWPADLL